MGNALSSAGELVPARENYDKGLALYSPAEHRPLATRFGQDMRVGILMQRSVTMWILGYPNAAQADVNQALADAREIGQAGTLMVALCITSLAHLLCGNFSAAEAQSDEVIPLAKEKGSPIWESFGMMNRGCVLQANDRDAEAVETTTAGMAVYRATRATVYLPFFLSHLSVSYARLGRFEDASSCIHEAMNRVESTKERWCEADVNRIAGEVALLSPEPDAAKAQTYFERALTVARQQQAKSLELRTAMSMARLWRDQGKLQ
jgi:predicted ATPase